MVGGKELTLFGREAERMATLRGQGVLPFEVLLCGCLPCAEGGLLHGEGCGPPPPPPRLIGCGRAAALGELLTHGWLDLLANVPLWILGKGFGQDDAPFEVLPCGCLPCVDFMMGWLATWGGQAPPQPPRFLDADAQRAWAR